MIGHAGDAGGEGQVQLAALGVLLGDGGHVLKNGGNQGVNFVLVHVVPGQDHRAHGHGAGIGDGGAGAGVLVGGGGRVAGGSLAGGGLAAGAQGQKQADDQQYCD